MPPAVCPDSDPEEDDVLLAGEEDLSQQSTFSWAARQAEKVLANDELTMQATVQQAPDGTNSSEIGRQIASAQRNLFADSVQASKTGPAMPSSTSPVMERNKRRRATEAASDSANTPSRSVKRTKTTKTYGSTSSKTMGRPADDDEKWQAFRDESVPVAKTSQPARFSDHSSGINPSPGLPPRTIQQDFMNHEPNEMFRDTGDTNAFNESSEQRMVETVLNGDGIPADQESTANGVVNGTASDKQQDSSFPWSASAGTPKPNKPDSQSHLPDVANGDAPNPVNEKAKAAAETPRDEDATGKTGNEEIQVNLPEKHDQSSKVPPRSSPIVEIPRVQAPSAASSKATQDSPHEETAEKKPCGRRRNTVNEKEQKPKSDPLNSDDKLVGLPKELYKPRPSRRRATEVLEPIDFSQVPEKTAKKRRKTANSDLDKVNAETTAKQTQSPRVAPSIKTDETQSKVSDKPGADEPSSNDSAQEKETEAEEATSKRRKTPNRPSIEPLSPPPAAEAPEPYSKEKDTPNTRRPSPDDKMLMEPPPLPPSSKKRLARSKTTIFEDHVEFRRSPRKSPSLSQQQASRKSVLNEVQNEAIQPKRQARRPVVQDDEDEEDELAKEEIAVEKPQPQKRGRPPKAKEAPEKKAKSAERVLPDSEEEGDNFTNGAEDEEADEEPPTTKKKPGRPSKAKAAPEKKAKSAEKVLPDSEDEEDDFVDGAEDEEAEEEPPTKKKRPGRPATAKPQAQQKTGCETAAKSSTAPATDKVTIPSSDMAALGQSSPSKAALERKDPNRQLETDNAASPPTKINTPTPQRTVHSPIKSSSGTTTMYRVGLNKKHKIPSLLKVIRPPKPPTTR